MIALFTFSVLCGYLLIRLIIFTIKHAIRRNKLSKFPQNPVSFYLGETKFFKKRPVHTHFIQTLDEMADSFVQKEKMFLTWFATVPAIVTFNRKHIEQILSKGDDEILNKGRFLYTGVDDTMPNSLISIEGSKWKKRREILSAPFHTTKLDNFVGIVNFESARSIKSLKKSPRVDVEREMKKLSILIYSKLLFDYNLEDEIDRAVLLSDKMTEIMARKSFSVFTFSPFLYRFTSLASEENRVLKELMSFKNRMLNAFKSKLDSPNLLGKNNLTLIEQLLTNVENRVKEKTTEWEGFDMDELRSQLDTFIVAGFDMQSAALTFLLYHLAQFPEAQERIYEEIVRVCGRDLSQELTFEHVRQFRRLDAFIAESMRVQPVVPMVSRKTTTKEVQLDEKYTVPADTDIVIFIEKVLKDPDYFPDPETFKPDRFLDSDQKDLYTNIAFSGGVRNCLAKRTALQVLNLVAANLLRHYRVEFTPFTPRKLENIKFELVNKVSDVLELQFVPRPVCCSKV